jgi:SAM-dependent methyltransferase
MNEREVLKIYDARYAATYDETFILSEHYIEATEYELALLRDWLRPGDRWLDVACGTGFFFSRFPAVERCGLDLSADMLARARVANPDATFVQGSFVEPHKAWRDQWDLVTCMWWAYCYASIDDIFTLIRNLAAWTSPRGTCFMPVCDPEVLCKTRFPSVDGGTEIAAVIWNWTDQRCGTRHDGLIAPHLDHLISLFDSLFASVEVLDYPAFRADAVGGTRRAIRASGKRPLEVTYSGVSRRA